MILSFRWRRLALMLTMIFVGAIGLSASRTHAQAGDLRYGDPVQGTVSATVKQDWSFAAAAGDVLTLELTRTSGNLLAVVTLLDTDGQTLLATQATISGNESKLTLFGVRITQSGAYTIRVSSLRETSGGYTLLVKNSAIPVMTPTPVNFALAGTLTYGAPARGAIRGTVFEQVWRFKGTAGDVVDIRMTALSGDLDSYFTLISPANDFIAANDSADGGKDAGLFSVTLPQNGQYTLNARRGGGSQAATTGEYELLVTLKTVNRGVGNTVLPINGSLIGRLNNAAPIAEYRLEAGGIIAFSYELRALHRLARATLVDNTGAILASKQGIAPLWFSVKVPDKGPYFLQLSSERFSDEPNADFTISSYKLAAPAQPLRFGEAQYSTERAESRWFFIGRAGDLDRISIRPSRGALNRTAVIRGPGDVVIFQGNLSPQFDQPVTLPATGIYQITVEADPGQTSLGYAVRVEPFGVAGVPFERYPSGNPRGVLSFDKPVTGALKPSEAWIVDVNAGTILSLSVQASNSTQALAVMVRAPDDTLLGAASGVGTLLLPRVQLPRDGRYQVIAFDPGGTGGSYTLHIEDAGGGQIAPEQPVKGVVLPANAYAEWTIEAVAGSLLNARLITRTPGIWTPALYAIDPSGEVIGRAAIRGDQNSVRLLGIEAKTSGRYRIIVGGGSLTAAFASYELTVGIQPLFSTDQPINALQSQREALPRFSPATRDPLRPPQVADLIAPPIPPLTNLFASEVISLPANTLLRGEIVPGALQQVWRVVANVNTTISLQATVLSGGISPQLTLLNREGRIVAEELRGSGTNTTLTYRVTQAGDYALVVRIGLNAARYTIYYQSTNLRTGPLTILPGTPIVYGQTWIGEMLTPGQTDTYYFYGALNEIISVRAARIAGDFQPAVQVSSLGGKALGTEINNEGKPEAILDGVRISEVGVYAVRVSHSAADGDKKTTGRYALYLGITSASRLKNRIGGVLEPGQTVTGALILADNEDTWLLSGRAGESLTLSASALDPANEPTPLTLRLQDTAGNTFAARDIFLSQDVARLENITLPADGIYRVVVIGGGTTQGGYRLTRDVSTGRNQPGIINYGQTVGGVFNAARNAERWTFAGNAGDVVSIALNGVRGDDVRAGFQILAENGLALATAVDRGDGSGARAETISLPFSGAYTILVANPQSDFKGKTVYALSLVLQESNARNLGGTLQPDQRWFGDLYPDDSSDLWLFSGRAGQSVQLSVTPNTPDFVPVVTLRDRNGSAQPVTGQLTLPADGVYIIEVTGKDKKPGRYTIGFVLAETLVPPPAISYGGSVAGLIADDRVTDAHVFRGNEGDVIAARASREPGSPLALVLELRDENGGLLARADALGGDNALIEGFTLPRTANYTLSATRINGVSGQTSGRLNVAINAAPAKFPMRGKLPPSQRGIGRLDDANPIDRWTYTGKAGEVIGVISRATSGDLDTRLAVFAPDGTLIAENDDPRGTVNTDAAINGARLPVDGTYTVVLSRVGTRGKGSGGNYELRADRVFIEPVGSVTGTITPTNPAGVRVAAPGVLGYGGRAVGAINAETPEARYVFSGIEGDEINLSLLHTTDDAPPILTIEDTVGTRLVAGTLKTGQTVIETYKLPITASYIISIKRPVNARAVYSPFTLSLNLLRSAYFAPSTGGWLGDSNSVIGILNGGDGSGTANNTNLWVIKGTAGQSISIDLIPLTGTLRPSLVLLNPAGAEIIRRALDSGGSLLSLRELKLPSDGIYTLLVQTGSGQSGTYRLDLRSQAGTPEASVLPAETIVTGALNDLQPRVRYRISAQKGDTINARLLALKGDLLPQLTLNRDGQPLAEARAERTSIGDAAVLEGWIAPDAGQFELEAATALTTQGQYALIYSTRPISTALVAALSINYGQAISDTLTASRPALYRFAGKKGEAINAAALPGKTGIVPLISLQDSAGTTLQTATAPDSKMREAALTGFVLPADGNYVIALIAPNTTAYSLILQRKQDSRPPQPSGRILVAGANQQNGILPNELVNYWTIPGKVGQAIKLTLTPLNSTVRLDVSIYTPSGAYLAGGTAGTAGGALKIDPFTLPEDGTYQVVVGRWLGAQGVNTGRYSLIIETP